MYVGQLSERVSERRYSSIRSQGAQNPDASVSIHKSITTSRYKAGLEMEI